MTEEERNIHDLIVILDRINAAKLLSKAASLNFNHGRNATYYANADQA